MGHWVLGLITAPIIIIIGIVVIIRNTAKLKKCLIKELNSNVDVFNYNGKKYDKKKYMQQLKSDMSDSTLDEIQEHIKTAEKLLKKPKYQEWALVDLEVMKQIINERN